MCVCICGAQRPFFVIIKHNPLLYSAQRVGTQEEQNIIYHRVRWRGPKVMDVSISPRMFDFTNEQQERRI
jgi:hypothetical protein